MDDAIRVTNSLNEVYKFTAREITEIFMYNKIFLSLFAVTDVKY